MDQVVCFVCFLSFLKQVNEEDKNVTPIFKRASEATEGLRTLLRITDYHLCRAVRPLSHRVQMSAAPWPLFYGASSAAAGFGAMKKFSKGYMQQTLRHWTNLNVRVCVLGIRPSSKQSSGDKFSNFSKVQIFFFFDLWEEENPWCRLSKEI